MGFLRRKDSSGSTPIVPEAQSLDEVIQTVLQKRAPLVRCSPFEVEALERGGCLIRLQSTFGDITTAIMQLGSMRQRLSGSGYNVQLHVTAFVEGQWELPGGIRRRTPPGTLQRRESFSDEAKVKEWLKSPLGNHMAHSNTLRWVISVMPK